MVPALKKQIACFTCVLRKLFFKNRENRKDIHIYVDKSFNFLLRLFKNN